MREYTATSENFRVSTARALTPRNLYKIVGKRITDVALALLIAPLALIVVGVVAVIMTVSGEGGHLFFGHRRIGKNGRVFKCWKIRTMVLDAEIRLREHLASDPEAAAEWASDHKLTNDPRITGVGRFLRRTSLDELPQIWNVLKGDMSFVGPRPIVRLEMHKYGSDRPVYTSVKPGVTGLWQVSGRNNISYAERVQMDVEYVNSMSLARDLGLILRTVLVVVLPTGK
ncbi:sugar transferase [Sagittula sp. MA-2]|uniref:sugar transferase n=1 Tax=Sagittula sp. MA-2 TaxID=3048007 RepID=UPI0024C340C3|nr:sugar transferase [Sagittula sp. MA-2]WHZ37719.1 sugar transferase [Sagittula sp. MA-2]